MSRRRGGFPWLVSGILLLTVSGSGLLLLVAMVVPELLTGDRCVTNGPHPGLASGVTETSTVEQGWQWAPMGHTCVWTRPDGHRVTTSATSWGESASGVGVLVGVFAGSGLVVTGLARETRVV